MARTEKITVIIPVYNGGRYLAEAIESVLTQTYPPFEIIVVDDGSTDGSANIAKSFTDSRMRYLYQPNSGLSAALNTGIHQARGDLFAFLDSDDVWLPEKLVLEMTALENNPEVHMVFGHVDQFFSPDLESHVLTKLKNVEGTMTGYSAGTLLIARDTFHRVGPFATDIHVGQFIDWYSRAKELGLKGLMLPEVVMRRRIHASNMGILESDAKTDYVKVLKAVLDRRRERTLQGNKTKQHHGEE